MEEHPEEPAGFGKKQVVGATAWLVLSSAAAILGLTASSDILTSASNSQAYRYGWLLLMTAAFAAVLAYGAHLARDSLGCALVFCSGKQDSTLYTAGIGLLLVLVAGVFVVNCLVMLLALKRTGNANSAEVPRGTQPSTLKDVSQRRKRLAACSGACLAVLVIPPLFFLTTILPNAYHLSPSDISKFMAENVTTAEVDNAWMVTKNIKLSDQVVLKVFPDTLMFYAFLEILAVISMAAVMFPPLGRWLHRKSDPMGFTRGETVTMFLFATLFFCWSWYWLMDHNYHAGKPQIQDSWYERVARTWGQLAILTMSLLLLPATKNSVWLQALGVTWERSLWMHRYLGGLCLLLMALHILSFWARFSQLKSFPYDAFAYIQYYSINHDLVNPSKPDYDNWTIAIMQLIAYPALFMVGISSLVRRKHWELFKYFHYVFVALIPALLLHSASAWYFLLGGIAFWLVDSAIRFSCVVNTAASLMPDGVTTHSAEGGIIELRMRWTHPEPGQFAWIKVPQISTWEWHPFSLSSTPYDGFAQVCIKNMGPDTFTDRLYKLGGDASSFDIQVDGPYGSPPDIQDHGALLLIAGGIGITQVHSLFRTVSQMVESGIEFPFLRSVHIVWIAKTTDLFEVFRASISESLKPTKIQFDATFFCTQTDITEPQDSPAVTQQEAGDEQASKSLFQSITDTIESLTGLDFDGDGAIGGQTAVEAVEAVESSPPSTELKFDPSIKVKAGRPIFEDLYDSSIAAAGESTVLVQVCGPDSMVLAAAKAAKDKEGIVFDNATFTL
eukprot:TRINITY_DN26492_c0_g1_i1.p1 TRINITY_DN26492_c0_g1~~TRINITY_DN26492_c0_g1_i1.p1  ORF type:complete len:905 (+),score=114.85 TRINITY_DN26492_c0_g1_i1:365-2716(+)